DDEPAVRQLELLALSTFGFTVDEARSGEEALELWARERHGLILLDLNMPGIGGFEACRRIRAMPGGEHVPILVVTGANDNDSVRAAFNAGATDFLLKPMSLIMLENRVRYALRSSDALERLRESERSVRKLAYHDSLTGLGNRRFAQDRLSSAVAAAKRHGRMLAVLFLDLDKFKRINDTLGHGAGDALLREVAHRLSDAVRSSDSVSRLNDPDDSAVSRLGGDEFTVVLSEIREPHDAANVARRILHTLAAPMSLEGHEVVVGASIGLAIFPRDGETPEALMCNADAALYSAKEAGRNTFKFYDRALNAVAHERLALEEGLRRALDRDELELFWQPIVETCSGRTVGAEALLRWRDPTRGMVGPDQFIPLAEDTGLIVPIGDWVLRAACSQLAAWRASGATPPQFRAAINLSPVQLAREGFAERVRAILAAHDLAPGSIELEITERTLIRAEATVEANLRALRAIGLRLSLDDFGTGFSSLSYLRRFRFDTLKIDRSFVRDVMVDPEDAAITTAILSMSHALGLEVVAEGVETEAQRAFLTERRCDRMQGYLFSRPADAETIAALFDKGFGGASSSMRPHPAPAERRAPAAMPRFTHPPIAA
ncbi:MAG: EAL domain-containing protein, partial [bacterium]